MIRGLLGLGLHLSEEASGRERGTLQKNRAAREADAERLLSGCRGSACRPAHNGAVVDASSSARAWRWGWHGSRVGQQRRHQAEQSGLDRRCSESTDNLFGLSGRQWKGTTART